MWARYRYIETIIVDLKRELKSSVRGTKLYDIAQLLLVPYIMFTFKLRLDEGETQTYL
uniref:Uncharacterized protein n=1 Tax=Lepeophtheirus salmonis TaxID=72036 RepID=A0A0K2VHZ8_LEPSM